MKKIKYTTSPAVCSQSIDIEISDDNKISLVRFNGGCPGSLSAVSALVRDRTVPQAIAILDGIKCGNKKTSCPDQLAQALKKFCSQHK